VFDTIHASALQIPFKPRTVVGRGSKREAIRQFVRQSIADEFTVADVRRAAAAASQSYLSKTLAKMRDEGLIEPIGAGKSAHWRRIRSDF
jgi:hypothetical protein